MKKLLIIPFIIIVCLFCALSVSAGDLKVKAVEPTLGQKVVLDQGVTAVYKGKAANGEHIWEATFSTPQYLPDLKTEIDCRWIYNAGSKSWTAGANLFTATASSTLTLVQYGKQSMTWSPEVSINNKVLPILSTQLLLDDPINKNYHGNTLQWLYPSGITRNLRIIEGMLIEYYIISEIPNGNLAVRPKIKNSTLTPRAPTVFDAEDNPVHFVLDGKDVLITRENIANAKLPVIIDPDVDFTTSVSDGKIINTDANYATSRTATTGTVYDTSTSFEIGQSKPAGNYRIARSFVYFDTSSLPDSISVSAAVLSLYGKTDASTTNFDMVVQNGMPTYPHDPLAAGDYDLTHYSSDGGSLTTAGFNTAGYNDITLNATGWSWINKTGTTKFALRSSRDIAATTPSGDEYVYVYAYEKGAGYQPYLTVTYSITSPVITADAASNIATTTARLNSTVVDDGSEACEVRFGYGKTSQAAIDFNSYTTITAWVAGYVTGNHPYYDASGLSGGPPTYYYRAQIKNSSGTVTSTNEQTFDVLGSLNPPTSLIAVPQSTQVTLTWAKGIGSTQTLVKYAFDTYPATTADGTQLYLGTNTTTNHTGLSAGTTVYYSAWGESGGSYSAAKATVMITTSAFDTAAGTISDTSQPAGWFQSPDYTKMANIPVVYGAMNGVADTLGMPRSNFWLLLMMSASVACGIGTYAKTQSLAGSGIVLTVIMGFGFALGLVPLWMPAMSGVMVIGMLLIRRQF